jgi:hypothetical protein
VVFSQELNGNYIYPQIASNYVESLDRLLEVYEQIGEAMPGMKEYEKVFDRYPRIRSVLEVYFCDILEFNLNALEVFDRPGRSSHLLL